MFVEIEDEHGATHEIERDMSRRTSNASRPDPVLVPRDVMGPLLSLAADGLDALEASNSSPSQKEWFGESYKAAVGLFNGTRVINR